MSDINEKNTPAAENGKGKDKKDNQGIVIKKRDIIIAVIIILLLLIGSVTVAFNWNNWFGGGAQPAETSDVSVVSGSSQINPDIDPNAGTWDGSTPKDKSESSAVGIKIPGYPSITLPANQKNVTMALLNPEGNPCYFKFEIVLKDTGETIFESKLVPPGQALTDITLSRALEAGEYNAVIKITTSSLETLSAMNGANVETVLIVK